MSATLLQDGTRSDIARSARPYLVTSKGTGLYTSDGVFSNFWSWNESPTPASCAYSICLQITHCIHNDMKPVTQTKSMLCLVAFL